MNFTYAKASEIAAKLQVDPAVVLAVADVESGGRHDLPDGRPQILFEAHWFSKLTGHQYDATHPGISSREWDRSLYKGGAAEWGRLNAAIELDADAALQSASWGLFQIMGFNYKACGFASVTDFVNFIKGPDDADMEAFINFVKANPLILKAMREKDWKAFALHYNGPGAVASYSAKMADAYAKAANQPSRIEAGPPIPVADPTMKPKSAITSKTVLSAALSGGTVATVLADNVQPALDAAQAAANAAQQAKTLAGSFKDLLGAFGNGHVFTVVLLSVALGAIAFFGIRYVLKMRHGDVVAK
jgi:hypothetical protein